MLCGDFNVDMSRENRYVEIVKQFINDLGLKVFWSDSENPKIQSVDYTCTKIINGVAYYSTLDHFMSITTVYNIVDEASVIHSGENLSDHSPINSKLKKLKT